MSHRNTFSKSPYIIFTFSPLFIMSSNKTSLQDRCKALSQSILKESTVFESSDSPSEDENAPSHAEDIRAQIQSAAGVVEHESTKIGLLFAKNEPIADDVSNSALDAFHVSLIAFTAYIIAALRANRSVLASATSPRSRTAPVALKTECPCFGPMALRPAA